MSAAKRSPSEPPRKLTYRLPKDGAWANAWRVSAALGAIGLLGCAFGYAGDPHRFAFSWLFAFMSVLAIALGSLFFVLAQHLTGAGWGVTIRRTAEFFMIPIPVLALLFVPVLTHMDELYPWVHHWDEHQREHAGEAEHEEEAAPEGEGEGAAEEGEHGSRETLLGASVASAQDHGEGGGEGETPPDTRPEPGVPDFIEPGHMPPHSAMTHAQHHAHEEVVESKFWWLGRDAFWMRAALYFAIWFGLAFFFFRYSTRQDVERGLERSIWMQRMAPLCTFAYALTLTCAAFDWMMSLEPTWFSTIFGVQYWSVCAVSSLSAIILTLHGLRSAGAFGPEAPVGSPGGTQAITTEHFHDLGKLTFGFLVFWAYVSFSQFMLIWYASIPEETTYYHLRWSGGWRFYSLAMVLVHFVIPFFLLMSRNIKRRVPILAFGAAWLLVTHVIEVFWLVMPYVSPGDLSVHWLDFAALFAVAGIYLTSVFFVMGTQPLIPVGDPRLQRALDLEV
jgi:hypothetical protein